MIESHRRAAIAAALLVCGVLLAFAGDGLAAYFTPDDMMNLYVSWSAPAAVLLHHDRPAGALFYRGMYAVFGLHPLPYRLVCFALLLVNLRLLYRFCERLTKSPEVALLACFLGAYHAHLADLYYSTGTIFDLLCFFFSLLAFDAYVRGRRAVVVLALYAGALASKEMAVVLPVYLLLYEMIYRRARLRDLARNCVLWAAAALTAVNVFLKVAGPYRMVTNPAYAPVLSLHVFFTAWKAYAGGLFYGAIAFSTLKLVLLWGVLAAFAVASRRRELWFACCVMMIGVLPFIFIAPRGFFVMYLVLPGWYLYAATVLVMVRDEVVRRVPHPEQVALLAIVAALLLPLHRREKAEPAAYLWRTQREVKAILGYLDEHVPTMPKGAKVLFLSDPYDADDWILTSTLRLRYHDPALQVDRVKQNPALVEKRGEYAHVFVLEREKMREER